MADLELSALTAAKRLVVIAATWGEGEPPARAVRAYNELMGEGAPRLDGVEFGVLALGDTAYAEFCAIGRKIDERLAALGGKRVADRVDCDLDFAAPAARWIGDAVKALTPPNAGGASSRSISAPSPPLPRAPTYSKREITEHVDLNSSRSDKETIHLALSFEGGAPAYEPGDSARSLSRERSGLRRRAAEDRRPCRRREVAQRIHQVTRRDHAFAQNRRDLRRLDWPSIRQGVAGRRSGARMDRRTPAHRSRSRRFRSRSMPTSCAH